MSKTTRVSFEEEIATLGAKIVTREDWLKKRSITHWSVPVLEYQMAVYQEAIDLFKTAAKEVEITEEQLDVLLQQRQLPDGQPCDHPGCLSHMTHPCEGCGRIGGRRVTIIDQ